MATVPAKDEKPTAAQRIAGATKTARWTIALGAIGALMTLGPAPFDAGGVGLVVGVAFELGRSKR